MQATALNSIVNAQAGRAFDASQLATLKTDARALWVATLKRRQALSDAGVNPLHPHVVALVALVSELDRLMGDATRCTTAGGCDPLGSRYTLGRTAERVMRAVAALDRIEAA